MKLILNCLVLLLTPGLLLAQEGAYTVTERGPHHRIWQKATQTVLPNGKTKTTISGSYTEIGGGLCYWDGTAWQDSVEEVRIENGFGVSDKGPISVRFSPNINTPGAIDMISDGQRFKSQILGLAYTDATGKSVLFAELHDSVGQVLGNTVVYPDAFDGMLADVRYTARRGGFSQDVLLRETPPSPESLGLDAKSSKLEVWTEFYDAPEPKKAQATLFAEAADTAVVDESLNFKRIRFGRGQAFSTGSAEGNKIPVGKTWTLLNGRTFLIEAVPVSQAAPQLNALPKPQAGLKRKSQSFQMAAVRDGQQKLPQRQQSKLNGQEIQTAKIDFGKAPSFVLDYEAAELILTNRTFYGNTTYYCSSPCSFVGVTTFEGGTVIKFTNNNNAKLTILGPIINATESYRPAVLTAMDDRTVGETIGTNASPSGRYAQYGLDLDCSNTNVSHVLRNFRISYAQVAINLFHGSGHSFTHCQFLNCDTIANSYWADSAFRNILAYNSTVFLSGSGSANTTSRVEHATFDQIGNINQNSNVTLFVTNSLIVSVTNTTIFTGTSNATNASSSSVFQTVGAGAHYLTTNSPYRNAGTTNINASLASDLRSKTTYPPQLVTNSIAVDTTWYPQAQRDLDVPDLGFHYDPIDFETSTLIISNATLTLTNGVTVSSWGQMAFWLQTNGSVISQGAPENPNRLARASCVQELSATDGNAFGTICRLVSFANSGFVSNSLSARFTKFFSTAGPAYAIEDWTAQGTKLNLRDCEMYGGGLYLQIATNAFLGLTNNLLWGAKFHMLSDGDNQNAGIVNNLFYHSGLDVEQSFPSNNVWIFRNNAFDNCSMTDFSDGNPITIDHNGYINVDFSFYWPDTNSTDVIVTNFTYQAGYLGNYYHQTNSAFYNKGYTNADLLTLYHYTTTTNQVKETNSLVDIGYHYVAAASTNGVVGPLDFDGDGIPDYWEDRNGNGSADVGESDWQAYTSLLGAGSGPGLKVFTPLR